MAVTYKEGVIILPYKVGELTFGCRITWDGPIDRRALVKNCIRGYQRHTGRRITLDHLNAWGVLNDLKIEDKRDTTSKTDTN